MSITSINPTTGQELGTYQQHEPAEVSRRLGETYEAHLAWRRRSFAERAEPLRRTAELLRRGRDQLARLMALEMGKPLAQGRAEADKCAWVCEHYADQAERYLAIEEISTEAWRSFVTFQPLGVILAVMPWNFPLWQVFRFAAPALMAGNGAVLKHASNVPGCALAIEALFAEAGLPSSLFASLLIPGAKVLDLIDDDRVAAVTLTGSESAGRAVAARAGRQLKKSVLELGGSDPYIVLEDADLEAAARICVASRLLNAGQSCIAAKRFIVVEPVKARFEELMVQGMSQARVGDPLIDGSEVGPMARRDLRDELHQQVRTSIEAGARCLLGGEIPEGSGAFYPPTVRTEVGAGMAAYSEELFGPVAAIIGAADEAEAIQMANDSAFGLGAAVFTADLERGERIASLELEAGCCFVNDFVKSDPRLPFGGIKISGYGRELAGYGIKEFTNIKTVYVA
jgi:succinate-semialdehyde dehydrogenase/glutarate-semialdehyde dehydrogenase